MSQVHKHPLIRLSPATATPTNALRRVGLRLRRGLRSALRSAVASLRTNRGALATLAFTLLFVLVVGVAAVVVLHVALSG